ncbi:hypothetical protein HG537_0H02390 [Torulaspora globosa]|uniref:DASH complex subunit DAM1 n=1 Tax=Torulaspora globosa TaxID=48254 RepID=A0A7H9HZW8_9SACH|nr:hypothetical protein HG537_0H02390 [Torulaspora sp. CBS 2947]
MSQDKPKISGKSATEYRLSITSNSGSRRSSLVGINDNGSNNRSTAISGNNEEDEDMLKTYILPQVREFTDSLSTLDSNFTQLNFIHESLVDFNESLGALLYGLMCNSWCVDFPYVSHDIAGELNVLERLESLAAEKDLLTKQLDQLKNQDKKSIEDNTKKTQFLRPSLPATQVRRPSQRRFIATQRSDEDDEEEIANSDASFISNPTMEFSKNQKGISKLRRKSILHTIRNSIASTSGVATTSELKRNRLSLGGGATRVLTNPSPLKAARTQRNSRNQATTTTRASATQQSRKQPSATVRPPFR